MLLIVKLGLNGYVWVCGEYPTSLCVIAKRILLLFFEQQRVTIIEIPKTEIPMNGHI